MTHVRTQIRTAVAQRLTGLATTENRVYPSRVRTLGDASLPCLLIYLDEEEVAVQGSLQSRDARLKIRAIAKESDDLDAVLDGIVAEAEAGLADGDVTFGGLIKGAVRLEGLEVDIDDTLETPVGVATLTYRLTYFTFAGSPGASA